VLDLVSAGMVSVWLSLANVSETLTTTVTELQETPWLAEPAQTDRTTQALLQNYLKGLAAKGLAPTTQGVWLQSGPVVLANNQGTTPLPAASLTKVATSLVALETWGTDHRFDTLISTNGEIQNGVLQGDLIIQGGGDPLFVWEEGFALGNTLNQMGIRKVTGNLVIVGAFQMNFEVDPRKAGALLQESLNSAKWGDDATYQYSEMLPPPAKPKVEIAGTVQVLAAGTPMPTEPTALIRHSSLPLAQILKLMNVNSNNVISESLAVMAGGHQVVAQKAAMLANVPPDEILLVNGSGLGVENRISPRAVAAMYAVMQRYLEPKGLTIADLFPVSGLDLGTIDYRKIPKAAVVKTGTLNEVSALAGVLPTRDRGLIWFTIINRGTDLEDLREEQDRFLQQLVTQWGALPSVPVAIAPQQPGQVVKLLGSPQRNIIQTRPGLAVGNLQ